ncbi:MAG: AIR carboxylase family protein, partial [Mariniphaga sp.]
MEVTELLKSYKEGSVSLQDTLHLLRKQGIEDLGFAKIDSGRQARTGIPEVIYSAGKTKEQIKQIVERMHHSGVDILATRASEEIFEGVKEIVPDARFNSLAKTIVFHHNHREKTQGYIAIVAAGTSDMPVAEEAAETAEFLGNSVERIYDVGVAGIHRLFSKIELIKEARVIVVVAGME